jgi:Nucleoside-diphosphate-sugar pyrophosphorylase involved in lipopolysaccharide biosynthesis/translation initiation factor 2B, gamma/epsilon subunits (eIF-2Bgamma/eIF-2Bepsilon)
MSKNISQAVILAGGRGERLRPLTFSIPKPMAPINAIPFLDYLIYTIINAGIKKILILLGYKGSVIVDRYHSMRDIKIEFSYGTEEDQTGRRVLNAYPPLDDHFLLMYGDNYWPIEHEKMLYNYQELNAPVTTTVFSNKMAQASTALAIMYSLGAENIGFKV